MSFSIPMPPGHLKPRADNIDALIPASRIEQLRLAIPEGVKQITQVAIDNPAQFALISAGTMVAARAAFNVVRPRNALEAVALLLVLQVGMTQLGGLAADRGWIKFRIRNEAGELVPLVPAKVEHDAAAAPEA
jgi:hypothetical protein